MTAEKVAQVAYRVARDFMPGSATCATRKVGKAKTYKCYATYATYATQRPGKPDFMRVSWVSERVAQGGAER